MRSGDSVVFETVDARGGRAMRAFDRYVVPPPPPLSKLNPVTGPVFIRESRAGDTLLVEIEKIALGAKGYAIARKDIGVLQQMVRRPGAKVIRVQGSRVFFNDDITIPIRPMIETIGVAPHSGEVASQHHSKCYLPSGSDDALANGESFKWWYAQVFLADRPTESGAEKRMGSETRGQERRIGCGPFLPRRSNVDGLQRPKGTGYGKGDEDSAPA